MNFHDLRRAVQAAHGQGETITLAVDGMPYVAFQRHQTMSIMLMACPQDQHPLTETTFEALSLARAQTTSASARFFHQEALCQ